MKNFINHVQLIGHLGHDPELMEFGSDRKLVKLQLATNESYEDKSGETKAVTQWHTVSAWGDLALRMAEKLNKGNHVMITGKLENRNWEDKDGKRRYITQVKANAFRLFQLKSPSTEAENQNAYPF